MSNMRAALYDRYGPPEVLYEGRVPRPVPGPDEVLVQVHASSVNGGELLGRAGKLRLVTGAMSRGFPKRVGIDFAGEVTDVGTVATTLARGDRVWGVLPRAFGSTAEFVAVSPRHLAPTPTGITDVEAASLPGVGTTAITALRDKAAVQKGERLLVRGGSGGVGSVAVQLGKAYGAHVTALASSKHLDFVHTLGADEVLDYRTTDTKDLDRFDVVLDTVGTDLRAYRRLLTRSGRMVAITFDSTRKLASLAYIVGSTAFGRRRIQFFSGNPDTKLLEDLTHLTNSGAIHPVVDRVYPLADIAKAHRALETDSIRGKIVIEII